MKRTVMFITIAILLFVASAYALEPTHSSGPLTADGAGWANPCYLVKIKAHADGTNSLNVKVYDHASAASGTKITEFTIPAGEYNGSEAFSNLDLNAGIYFDITTSGTGTVWAEFKKK